MWTSIATEGYIGVTGHFIDSSWRMQSLVLATEAMEERHTRVNISDRLAQIASQWKITAKVAGLVLDNASNMVVAADLLELNHDWPHVHCVGHTLQLSVNEGLKDNAIAKVVSIARKMVGHFNHSALATTKPHKMQEQLLFTKIYLKLVDHYST